MSDPSDAPNCEFCGEIHSGTCSQDPDADLLI